MNRSMFRACTACFFACAALLWSTGLRAGTDEAALTVERVFAEPDLAGAVAQNVKLSPDGSRVTFLRPRADDRTRLDLWVANVATTEPASRLVDSLALEGGAAMDDEERARRERQRIDATGVSDYQWNATGTELLVPLAGQLWVVDAGTGAARVLLGRDADRGTATDARYSPRGQWVGFVAGGRLYAVPAAGGAPRALSPAASDGVSYGVAEFVAQEEMARDTGYWWSPDEEAIAYTRVDESGVALAQRVEIGATGADAVRVVQQRFPRAGSANARIELYVQRLAGGEPVRVDLGPDADIYLARVAWSQDAKTLYVQRQSRDQRTLELLGVEPSTGRSRVLVTESRAPWVNLTNGFTPLRDGGFLWESERSGYRHLYLYDRDARLVRAVTSGAFPIAGADRAPSVVGIDERRGVVYVLGFADTPLEQHLYAASYRRTGPLRRLTEGRGWWTARMSADGRRYVATYSSFDTPPRTAVYDADGARRRWIAENPLDATHPYFPYRAGLPVPEFGELRAEDGQTLHYFLLKPRNFDPTKRHPVIVQVYGGPSRQKVTRAWRPPVERLYLDAGYVVFQLDNRGSTNRGVAFESPLAGALGGVEVRDQLRGVEFLKTLPYVDPARIGVTGWSYGGYMTLRLMTDPQSPFAAGIAGAAGSLWRLYDTHYTERYLGRPQDAPAAYEAASVVPRLYQLRGRLLYVHGMADDNVLLENATAIMYELQRLGTPFDLMLYPGQRHGIGPPALQMHLWRTSLEFFARTIGAGPTR